MEREWWITYGLTETRVCDFSVSFDVCIMEQRLHTPEVKWRPAIVRPSLGTTRGRFQGTEGQTRRVSLIFKEAG